MVKASQITTNADVFADTTIFHISYDRYILSTRLWVQVKRKIGTRFCCPLSSTFKPVFIVISFLWMLIDSDLKKLYGNIGVMIWVVILKFSNGHLFGTINVAMIYLVSIIEYHSMMNRYLREHLRTMVLSVTPTNGTDCCTNDNTSTFANEMLGIQLNSALVFWLCIMLKAKLLQYRSNCNYKKSEQWYEMYVSEWT